MAYTDLPVTTASAQQLGNNIDLTITVGNRVFFPNGYELFLLHQYLIFNIQYSIME